MKKDKINLNISLIRSILCISVLLYHLNILKGGYLAVCAFFVLTGYFTSKSLYKSKSLLSYYIKRIKKIYIPLIIVVFSTTSLLVLLKYNIFNLKTEISSIIFGYNNYWQLSSNADYFAKHINSPFMHLWYIAILLQLELLFPLLFITLKKIGKKISNIIPLVIVLLLAIISTIYFYKNSLNNNIMTTYYDTIIRSFSYIYGVLLYFIHLSIKKVLVFIKNIKLEIIIFILYIVSLLVLFTLIDATSKYFAISMILTSLITLRLIEYSLVLKYKNKEIKNKLIKFISDISYEIYLVQYPVIFLFSSIKINNIIKKSLIISVTIIVSWIINFALKALKKGKLRVLKTIILILILSITSYGIYQYIIMKDYTQEMNNLKDTLNNNEEIMKQKQEEYLKRQQEEEKNLDTYIKSLELDEEKLHEQVKSLKIVGIGDSILLDAIDTLYKQFPNGYFDGKISRTTCAGADVLAEIKNKGITWDVLVFNLGTNGYPNDKCKDKIMQYVSEETQVFWLNTTHADYDNNNIELEKYAKNHSNIHILDWETVIKNHPEYLYADYIHLRPQGFKPYAEFIENSIYNYYLEKYNQEKEKQINEYKNKQSEKYNFYGNDLLINSYDLLQDEYQNSKFVADNNLNYNKLIKNLENDTALNKKLIFIFDEQSNISENNYKEIITKYVDHEIYIVTPKKLKLDYDNVKMLEINFTEEDYLSDKTHLNKNGNKKLVEKIKELLNN